ncbi:MAG: hypothetical protein D3925_06245 [Candidatus Electrothrix sp. AR5]|nr:hypothetical protein [Candidatus Electrothrix sp. AR5]
MKLQYYTIQNVETKNTFKKLTSLDWSMKNLLRSKANNTELNLIHKKVFKEKRKHNGENL